MIEPHSSFIEILAGWTALAILLGWTLPKRFQVPAIGACGAGLLASVSLLSLSLLAAGTLLTWWTARRAWLIPVGIALIVAAYVAVLANAGHAAPGGMPAWVVPLGMAYYTLRLIHYSIEAGRGGLRAHGLAEYLPYHFMPSALPVGPIHRFDDFLRDLRRRRWDPELFSEGLSRALVGGFKVVVIASALLPKAFELAGLEETTEPGFDYLAMLRFWLNLYVQFSGYTDLAIGAAMAMGFRLPENFRFPFLARNIGDFWTRWHISLATWCRDYIYMPVLARWRAPALASSASMVVLGLWHELSLRYLLWGLYHALGLIVWRRFSRASEPWLARQAPATRNIWRLAATILTLHFVIFSYPVTLWVQGLVTR